MLLIEEIIKAKRNALKDVQENIFDFLKVAIEKHKDLFIKTNRTQLELGINSLSEDIRPAYTINTRKIKESKNQENRWVTLKDTGDFHKSIKIKIDTSGFEMFATDPKTSDLELKYSVYIIGITEENLQHILETTIQNELYLLIKQTIENA